MKDKEPKYDTFIAFDAQTGEPVLMAKEKGKQLHEPTAKELSEHMNQVRKPK